MEKIKSMNMQILLVGLFLFLVKSNATKLAPALYIFGDSTVDVGNNNLNAHSNAKANYPPYGIDYPAGPTGRFSNGKNMADIIADLLELPTPPAIIGFNKKNVQTTGFNYASASSGILDESGVRASGWNLNMRKQVRLFRRTVKKYLPSHFKNEHRLKRHLSESIYVIVSGSNDYAMNFLNRQFYNSSMIYNPMSFADHVLNELGGHIQGLYKLGARKFVLFEIAPLGCLPSTLGLLKPLTRCAEEINALVGVYNMKLPIQVNRLTTSLKGSTIVTAKTFNLFHDVILNPVTYGLWDAVTPCCPNQCMPNEVPCTDRDTHVFWDHSHPSEAASRIAATKCFNGTGVCVPISISELARTRRIA